VVVCRLAGVSSWYRAARHLGVTLGGVYNWESARRGIPSLLTRKAVPGYKSRYAYRWHAPKGALLVFDECHMGNNDGTQNNAMWTASRGVPSLSLSATFADRPARLRGVWSVLGRDDFDDWLMGKGAFVNQYGDVETVSAESDMLDANHIIFPEYGVRLSYNDPSVKKWFPDGVYQLEILTLTEKQREQQNAEYVKLIEKVAYYQGLGKQAEAMVADLRYRQSAELRKAPMLADLAAEYMYEGKSVAVFVNFRETLAYLAKALNTRCLIFGDQERHGLVRDTVVEDFQENRSPVILAMADAGGQSLSLHDLHGRQRVSLICPTYNPISLKQILGRTRRAGSLSAPIMKLVYAGGTVEEKVADTVARKLDNIAALQDGELMEPDLFNLGYRRA